MSIATVTAWFIAILVGSYLVGVCTYTASETTLSRTAYKSCVIASVAGFNALIATLWSQVDPIGAPKRVASILVASVLLLILVGIIAVLRFVWKKWSPELLSALINSFSKKDSAPSR